jgi:predicted ATP-dependent endonuclease of OLD family
LKQQNVIVEGLSDFWILKGVNKILRPKSTFEFIPSIGIKESKVYPLISFCIGYGLDWVLLMDNGDIPKQTLENLKTNLFGGSDGEANNKIRLIPFSDIENMFDINDLRLVYSNIILDSEKLPIALIGKSRKIIFSRTFYSKIEAGEIKKEHLQTSTIKHFEDIFDWIDERFSPKKTASIPAPLQA